MYVKQSGSHALADRLTGWKAQKWAKSPNIHRKSDARRHSVLDKVASPIIVGKVDTLIYGVGHLGDYLGNTSLDM